MKYKTRFLENGGFELKIKKDFDGLKVLFMMFNCILVQIKRSTNVESKLVV